MLAVGCVAMGATAASGSTDRATSTPSRTVYAGHGTSRSGERIGAKLLVVRLSSGELTIRGKSVNTGCPADFSTASAPLTDGHFTLDEEGRTPTTMDHLHLQGQFKNARVAKVNLTYTIATLDDPVSCSSSGSFKVRALP